jgi:hypothetical protein
MRPYTGENCTDGDNIFNLFRLKIPVVGSFFEVYFQKDSGGIIHRVFLKLICLKI